MKTVPIEMAIDAINECLFSGASITKESVQIINNTLFDYFDMSIDLVDGGLEIYHKNKFKTFKFPKKKITEGWIHERVSMMEAYCDSYISNYKNISEIIKKENKIKGSFYYASYGIGVPIVFNCGAIDSTRDYLKSKGIKFTESISNAGYIKRFNISRSKENLAIIKSI